MIKVAAVIVFAALLVTASAGPVWKRTRNR